jgi:hypothetical protein
MLARMIQTISAYKKSLEVYAASRGWTVVEEPDVGIDDSDDEAPSESE